MARWARWLGIVSCWVCLAGPVRGGEQVVILTTASESVQDATKALAKQLTHDGIDSSIIELPSDTAAASAAIRKAAKLHPAAIAAGGSRAAVLALESTSEIPVVYFMVPNALDAPFQAPRSQHSQRVVGVTSDVSPHDQLAWIRRTTPRVHTIALPYSDRTQRTLEAYVTAGRRAGIKIMPISAARDDFPTAMTAIEESNCDGVLMIPDAQVYNSPNVQRLLLWGARHKKPTWTFSFNVVRAGALAGSSCDSTQVGQQAAAIIQRVIRERASPAEIGVQYPHVVQWAINGHTAKMIDISIKQELLEGVKELGARP